MSFYFLLLLSLVVSPVLSMNIYGMSPTCGPELSFSILTINGTGFLGQNISISIGAQPIDPSFFISMDNSSLSFLTPKNLTYGIYEVHLCSQGPLFNCTYVCSNCTTPNDNCTTPQCNNSTTNSSICCQEQCVPLNSTTSCLITAHYTVYSIPPILSSISPSSVAHKSNVSLFGQHFINCGRPTVRIQSSTSTQDIPAWFNSSNEVVFYVNHNIPSGVVTLSLDGQHFDSLSISPITLTNSPQYESDSDSMSAPGGGGSNYVWLYIMLGFFAVAAGGFLIFIIYRYKKNEYSRYEVLYALSRHVLTSL
eukprot:Phypoly_transcript_09600.p1 GENE.Phypoly_transcript_09600~~Phypoly_transcript_09600.p1  ORF type:complete len:308 (+),score=29.53 Phypoly_transcript_09600:422-1345(+)